MFEKMITTRFLKALEKLDYGLLNLTLPNGKSFTFNGKTMGDEASLTLHDWRVLPMLAEKGDIGFAESYKNGWWETDNLVSLFTIALKNEQMLSHYIYGGFLAKITAKFAYYLTRNTVEGSKKNIHAHYDLGNSFYKLWLDESMSYSAAIYKNPQNSLLEAQHNKYDRIIERLNPTGRLLEIGCGWGGFVERALHKQDYAIKALTISDEQYDFARARVGNKAEIAKQDYRIQTGKYDNIVSVEMFEAVGEAYWAGYFKNVKSLLAENGKAVIQTITIDNQYFEKYRETGDMIRTFIFPGGMLPSPLRFEQESEKMGLKTMDIFRFGKDYARTLEEWLVGFDKSIKEVKALGFDDNFIRIWRFYLTYCIASFSVGRTDVMQVELLHA
jgi:cyclopropane-fatty-acyl-phospholipid synthase